MQNFRMNFKAKCELIDLLLEIWEKQKISIGLETLRRFYEEMYCPSQVNHPENNC